MASRILFVDDEPGMRETLPKVLTLHGFEVISKATVPDALSQIASSKFDVLISDLNIGEPGDGFTVVSAMRRTQPDCFTFILTGYPAFETALQAIRNQVDDYLLKPAPIPDLVRAIEEKLRSAEHRQCHRIATKRISAVIRENAGQIVQRTLAAIKADAEFATLSLADEERVGPYRLLLAELADVLESPEPQAANANNLRKAALLGEVRRAQGYTIPLLIAGLRLLENSIFEVLAENLLVLDCSFVISDLRQLSSTLTWRLEQSVRSFQRARRRLIFERSDKGAGWFCERCLWNRPEPASESERLALAATIHAAFDAHTCDLPAGEGEQGKRLSAP